MRSLDQFALQDLSLAGTTRAILAAIRQAHARAQCCRQDGFLIFDLKLMATGLDGNGKWHTRIDGNEMTQRRKDSGVNGTVVNGTEVNDTPMLNDTASHRPALARPRVLIVGCGDVGLRIIPLLRTHFRVFALTRDPSRCALLRAAGAIPVQGDLDRPASLWRLAGLAGKVLHLAPPPNAGMRDTRMRTLLPLLGPVERLVYVSTSGVYGDCDGARFDETRSVAATTAPALQGGKGPTARAIRRIDAEQVLRRWARRSGARVSILRTPGIYAADRLPLQRLLAGTPALSEADDVYTNHVHADDLARMVVAALFKGGPQRVYHASDDSELKMGDYFDQVAQHFDLPPAPRLPRSELSTQVSHQLLSFMSESRRLINTRVKTELGVRLRYPTTEAGVAAAAKARINREAHGQV